MRKQYIVAFDSGTTSTKAIVYNQAGEPIATGQQPITCHYPQNGWVEQSPEDIWAATLATWRKALSEAKIDVTQVAGIGITNQRETTIVWDRKTGEPIYNAIVWQDRRTAKTCDALRAKGLEEMIQAKTGLILDAYFSATKLSWILDNVTGARARAEKGELAFGTVDCYLLWRLTNGKSHATDISNASRTMIFNIHEQKWDDELLEKLNIPKNLLPEVKDNIAEFGITDESHWQTAVPIFAMAGDQQAALIGQGCVREGLCKSTYGTGCFLMVNTGDSVGVSKNRLLQTVAYRIDNKICYATEGSIFSAGVTVQWMRDGIHLARSSDDTKRMAESVKDNGGVYFVPAFTGLGAPYWKPDVRAAILGITRDTKPDHIVRAGLEAVCYQSLDLLNAVRDDGENIQSLRVDGGMVKNDWLLQFMANVLDHEVIRSKYIEATARGVMQLVRLKLGWLDKLEDLADNFEQDRVFKAEADVSSEYQVWKGFVEKLIS